MHLNIKELRAGELEGWGEDGPFLTWLEGQLLIGVGRNQSVFDSSHFLFISLCPGSACLTTSLPWPFLITSHLLLMSDLLLIPDNSHGVESALHIMQLILWCFYFQAFLKSWTMMCRFLFKYWNFLVLQFLYWQPNVSFILLQTE